MFKHLSDKSLHVLLTFLNGIWASSDLPPSWLHSIIVPIPKPKKPSHLPSPYSPISLTSNVCKLMEKLIVRRAKWYLEYNNKLSCQQSGFRNRRKTIDHILRLHDIVQKSLANNHSVLAVFIDIEKAYDVVRKKVILAKLINLGINGRMLKFISFLSNHTFQVRVGSTLSMPKQLDTGTPQGSILSPLLFTIAINDLPGNITSSSA